MSGESETKIEASIRKQEDYLKSLQEKLRALKSKSKENRKKWEEKEKRYLQAYEQTSLDKEAARVLCIHPKTFGDWRGKRGLPSKYTRGLSDEENARRRDAYDETSSDKEAAARLGIASRTFQEWRLLQGLKSKITNRGRISVEEESRRCDAYERTESDKDAGVLLGMRQETFQSWRHDRGLLNKGPGRHCLSEDEHARRLAAYEETESFTEAAKRLGMASATLGGWCRSHGLKSKSKYRGQPRLSEDEHARRLAAYEKTSSDREAAEMLGMKHGTFSPWRKKRGLPNKGLGVGGWSYRLGKMCVGCNTPITDRNKSMLCQSCNGKQYFTLRQMRGAFYKRAALSPNDAIAELEEMKEEDPDIYEKWFADIMEKAVEQRSKSLTVRFDDYMEERKDALRLPSTRKPNYVHGLECFDVDDVNENGWKKVYYFPGQEVDAARMFLDVNASLLQYLQRWDKLLYDLTSKQYGWASYLAEKIDQDARDTIQMLTAYDRAVRPRKGNFLFKMGLDKLVRHGLVTKTDDGLYALAPEVREIEEKRRAITPS